MTKQPLKVRNALAKLKAQGILLPEDRDPRQLWLLVIMHPMDGNRGEVFCTHGRNYDKFAKRRGFEVIGHGFDRSQITAAARKLSLSLGEGYQPEFSAVHVAKRQPARPEPEASPYSSDDPVDVSDALNLDNND